MRRNALCLTLTLAALLLALLALPPAAYAQWFNDPYHGMVSVCNAPGNQDNARICSLADGNMLVAWYDRRNPEIPQIYYQVLNQSGFPLLQGNGLPLIDGSWSYAWGGDNPILLTDGQGGCLAIFSDKRSGDWQIYGQRFDWFGNRLWGALGLPLAIWPGAGIVQLKDVCSDEQGGAFICFATYYFPDSDIYCQKINNLGERLWGTYGVPIHIDPDTTAAEDRLVSDGQGGVLDVFKKYDPNGFWIQHLNSQGNPLLPQIGRPVLNASGSQAGGYILFGVPDGRGGGIWCYRTTGTYAYSILIRLNGQGQTLWQVSNAIPFQGWPQAMLRHPSDGTIWLSVWEDRTGGGNYTIYLYRSDIAGHALFGRHGLPYGGEVMTPIADGVITFNWNFNAPHTRLTASRVDSSGALIWTSPVGLNRMANAFVVEAAVNDGEDGAVLVFLDLRNASISGGDISAQRILSDGSLGNPPPPPVEYHPGELILAVSQGQVRFTLPAPGPVKIELFDLLGRKVAHIQKNYLQAGSYIERFDSAQLPSGIYFLRLSSNFERQIAKVAILK